MLAPSPLRDGARSWVFVLVMQLGLLPRPARVDHVGDRCGRAHACRWQIRTSDGWRYVFGGPTSESGLRDALRYFDGSAELAAGTVVVDALELHAPPGRFIA